MPTGEDAVRASSVWLSAGSGAFSLAVRFILLPSALRRSSNLSALNIVPLIRKFPGMGGTPAEQCSEDEDGPLAACTALWALRDPQEGV